MAIKKIIVPVIKKKRQITKEEIFDYSTYDKVIQVTYNFMINSSHSYQANELRNLIKLANNSSGIEKTKFIVQANKILNNLSQNKALWDLKPHIFDLAKPAKIKNSIGKLQAGSKFPYTPVRYDDKYLYFYDLWGNISWAYIASSCGFIQSNLYLGNFYHNTKNFVLGKANADDQLGVTIGSELYSVYGDNLSIGDVDAAIFVNRLKYTENITRVTPDKLIFEQ